MGRLNYFSSNLRLLRLALWLIATLFVFTWPSYAAFDVASRRQSSPERRLLDDAADGRLNRHSLIEAALIVGGTNDRTKLRQLEKQFAALADEISRALDPRSAEPERARAIREFLHQRVLGEYRSDASDVSETLKTGVFNCVSASVLYVALVEHCGLKVHAVQLPEHVRCEVIAGGLAIPIETTSIEASAQRLSRSGKSRVLNEIELIATIYYNRGVAAFDSGDLQAAIELNTIAVELDPGCRPARDNLLAAINNRVVELVRVNQPGQALQLLERGLQIAPKYRPFLTNRAYLQQQLP